MNDPKEFANRVSGLILDQIDRDRSINQENIAVLIERELMKNPEPEVNMPAFFGAAYDLLIAFKRQEKPAAGWSDELRAKTQELGLRLKPHGYNPWDETRP